MHPLLLYSSGSHLLPCFLVSLESFMSFCFFRRGVGQQQCRVKALSLRHLCETMTMFYRLCLATLSPPAVSRLQQVSTRSLVKTLPGRFVPGARLGRCHGNLSKPLRGEEYSRKDLNQNISFSYESILLLFFGLLLSTFLSLSL